MAEATVSDNVTQQPDNVKIKCYNCGKENPKVEVYCYNCGTLLQEPRMATVVLHEDTGQVNPKRRWGTARFDTETVLVLTIRDYDAPPIHVKVDSQKVLGRTHKDYTPDIDLGPYEAYERGVSRQHAALRQQSETIVIVDLNSANKTFLNGHALVPEQPRILRDGDEVRLGQLTMRVSFEDVPKPLR